MSIKSHVTGSVTFLRFSNLESKQELWYRCDDGFEFPVPLSDTNGAEFKATDKALYFMRWIRKHVDLINQGKL